MLHVRRPAVPLAAVALLAGCGSGGATTAPSDGSAPSRDQVRMALVRLGVQPREGDRTFRIPGHGMEPTLRPADRVIVRPYDERGPARGDVVAYTSRVGRDACGDGIRLARVARTGRERFVVLGDNRAVSCDSRTVGPVTRSELVGQVVAVYWPPGRVRRVR